jgi:DNA-binding NtrC family response regulator
MAQPKAKILIIDDEKTVCSSLKLALAGTFAFLVKPFTPADIRTVTARALGAVLG